MGEFTADAAFRAGYTLLRAGEPEAAITTWDQLGETGDSRILYWRGRAGADAGDEAGSRAHFEAAVAADPHSFHGLAAAGRYLAVRVRIPDRPGGLASLLNQLADAEANVLEVVHERTSAALHLDEVEVALQLETRGPEHAEGVLARLRECGYSVTE